MLHPAPYQALQVSDGTPCRFTSRLTFAAAFPTSTKHRYPGKHRPPAEAARRRSRLSSQYRPNSACRDWTSCIALRSFEAFWWRKTLDKLRQRPPCWISSRLRIFLMKSHDGPPCLTLYATTANLLQPSFSNMFFYLVRQLVLTHGYQDSMPRSPCYQSSPKPIHKRSGVSRITESSKAWVLLGMPLSSSRITHEKRPVAPVFHGLIRTTM